ncbi:MAG: aminodeoxychorismate synthase component I [Actinophytocola sp.]|nr:aminodeoxychorismate synthase component I [Actinophytocola sp.]
MRLECRRLSGDAPPERVLTLLDARARRLGLPQPAALIGDWFGSRAVLAPTVAITPVFGVDEAFAIPASTYPIPAADGAIGGGWFGYLGYDLTDPSRRAGPLPAAAWGWADHVLRLDRHGQWWFEALVGETEPRPDPGVLADELGALLAQPAQDAVSACWTPVTLRRPDGGTHTKAVRACIDAIEAGELFQANICSRFHGVFDGSAAALFAEGVRTLRPRRGAYLAGDWGTVVSLSPELFLAREGRLVRSTPIKGTLPRRGRSDDGNAELLRRSEKDVAENVMITDLVRNDLGRVSAVGTVTVPELLTVTEAPGVWHLESTVQGRLADGIDDADLLRAAFPPGSVTGAPKLRALDEIAELEPHPRGVYCGAAGLASPVAGMALNVAIRTFELAAGTIALGVGGGITALSDPELEWQECLHKAAPLEKLLRADGRN